MTTKARKPDDTLAATFPWLRPDVSEAPGPNVDPDVVASVVAPVPRVCLSRSEAARALGIGLTTLKALEREGIAPPAFEAPGGRKLYPVALLIKWASDKAREGNAVGAGA
jgi:hypothetical protein